MCMYLQNAKIRNGPLFADNSVRRRKMSMILVCGVDTQYETQFFANFSLVLSMANSTTYYCCCTTNKLQVNILYLQLTGNKF